MREKNMKNPVVSIRDLRKVYGSLTAVDGVSFEVYPGEIFDLLGVFLAAAAYLLLN
jgi:ABC-type phosphonate transport system ATPase subunit